MFNRDAIPRILKEKNWSRYKLCKEAHLAQSTLSDILSGKAKNPNINTLQKIADALGVSVNEFFDDNTHENGDKSNDKLNDEFDDEIRAMARNMKGLSKEKRKLLSDLIKTMSEMGDEELRKWIYPNMHDIIIAVKWQMNF